MEKKTGSRLAALLVYGISLMVVAKLVIALPWTAIPLGIVCIFFPKSVWKITGGFLHPYEKPTIFTLSRRRRFGFFLIIYAIAKYWSNSVLGGL